MNGIDVILADHERVNDLFDRFEATGDATLIGQIVDALNAHDDAEQAALYPLVGAVLGDETLIERSSHAHSEVKKLIEHLWALEGAPLVDSVAALRTAVTDHVADEERNLLPKLGKQATPEQLDGLAARIEQVKQRVG
jgi:hemerythrin superfamily protein